MAIRKNDDWQFDIGTDKRGFFQVEAWRGFFQVEAWASTIPHLIFSRLSREQMKQLQREINSALRRYPLPEKE